jgi:Surface antigen variable number repeat
MSRKFGTFVCSSLISLVASLGPAAHAQTAPPTRHLSMKVQSVSLSNDSSISSEHLQLIEKRILLSRFFGTQQIAQAAMEKLNTEGYWRAQAEVTATDVLNESAVLRTVAVALRIREGEQYRLRQITFEKSMLFPEAQLRQAFPINDGEIVSEDKLQEGERTLRGLYATKGYMQPTLDTSKSLDDEARTLSVHVAMQQGPQFTVNGLTLEGKQDWPEDKAAKLQALAQSFVGSHEVGVFIDAVKKQLAEMFPDYAQINALVGVTMGGQENRATVNVDYPDGPAQ